MISLFKYKLFGMDFWDYGACNGLPARRHIFKRNVQFVLWKAGQHGHKYDFWIDFDSSWWSWFVPKPNLTIDITDEVRERINNKLEEMTETNSTPTTENFGFEKKKPFTVDSSTIEHRGRPPKKPWKPFITETSKRPSYKSKWEEEVKEKRMWRKAFKGVSIFFAAYVIADILFEVFR
jgi:hypothetical protein